MKKTFLLFAIATLALGACGTPTQSANGKLKIVATTTLIGDVAKTIGGDYVDVKILFPPGADPHGFEPRPQDIVALSDAQMVLINGLGLEATIQPLLANAKQLIEVSQGITPLSLDGEHGGVDPHVWQDPANVMIWSQNIADALGQADPSHAEEYQANAENYITALKSLDAWIVEQVILIPIDQRKLVTEHDTFSYFAKKYRFEIVGAIIPSASASAAPSAQELAALEDAIRSLGVRAVFVGSTVSPALAEQVTRDTGTRLIRLYTDSLSTAGGEADTYLAFMRYNVNAITEALK
jgi:ABC-type Zn uptake system ZnuABC Zn-binding protein ZnuA